MKPSRATVMSDGRGHVKYIEIILMICSDKNTKMKTERFGSLHRGCVFIVRF